MNGADRVVRELLYSALRELLVVTGVRPNANIEFIYLPMPTIDLVELETEEAIGATVRC